MAVQVNLLPGAVAELFAQVSYSHTLTLADRYGLMAALLAESLDEEEQQAIDRLLRGVVRKQFSIVNQLSVVL